MQNLAPMFKVILYIHIGAGILGLVLGPIAMTARKIRGLHTTVGNVYHWNMLIVCITAGVMALFHWSESWFLLPIAIFSYYNALMGYLASKRRRPGWLGDHISGMLGSYIALVTATLVVNSSDIPILNRLPWLLLWFLPTIIATPIVIKIKKKFGPVRKAIT